MHGDDSIPGLNALLACFPAHIQLEDFSETPPPPPQEDLNIEHPSDGPDLQLRAMPLFPNCTGP